MDWMQMDGLTCGYSKNGTKLMDKDGFNGFTNTVWVEDSSKRTEVD